MTSKCFEFGAVQKCVHLQKSDVEHAATLMFVCKNPFNRLRYSQERGLQKLATFGKFSMHLRRETFSRPASRRPVLRGDRGGGVPRAPPVPGRRGGLDRYERGRRRGALRPARARRRASLRLLGLR